MNKTLISKLRKEIKKIKKTEKLVASIQCSSDSFGATAQLSEYCCWPWLQLQKMSRETFGKDRTHGNLATYFWYFGSFDKTNLQKYRFDL